MFVVCLKLTVALSTGTGIQGRSCPENTCVYTHAHEFTSLRELKTIQKLGNEGATDLLLLLLGIGEVD